MQKEESKGGLFVLFVLLPYNIDSIPQAIHCTSLAPGFLLPVLEDTTLLITICLYNINRGNKAHGYRVILMGKNWSCKKREKQNQSYGEVFEDVRGLIMFYRREGALEVWKLKDSKEKGLLLEQCERKLGRNRIKNIKSAKALEEAAITNWD